MLSRPSYRPHAPYGPWRPSIRAIGYGQSIPMVDSLWYSTWPYTASNIIAAFMLILALALIGLEIAFIVIIKGVDTQNALTSAVGIWSGFFILLAAVFIFVINCVNQVRAWAIVSFILNIIAACFAIIAFSINAYRVHWGVQFGIVFVNYFKLWAAELALALVAFLLCAAVIAIFAFVYIRISRASKQPQQNPYPIQRP